MRAKFSCQSITEFYYGQKEAKLTAVYDDGKPENNQFAEATPSGTMTILIDKKAAANDFLKVGKNYYLDFTESPD